MQDACCDDVSRDAPPRLGVGKASSEEVGPELGLVRSLFKVVLMRSNDYLGITFSQSKLDILGRVLGR